jgi:putative transposase
MPSTHLSLHYHLIFSPKGCHLFIAKEWRGRLHAFLGGEVRKIGGVPESIGGTNDHVHLLIGLRATHRLSDVLEDIKSGSSRWVHEELGVRKFAWQEGYGAFTVSASKIGAVKKYLENQEEHHRVKTFQEEYLWFLQESGIEFDERYLW